MTVAQVAERRNLYRVFRALPDDKAARVMGYIKSITMEEPPLNDDEEEGLRIANAELARGEGRSFRDAMKELW